MMDSDRQPVKDAETEGGSPSNTHPLTSNGIPLETYPGAVGSGGYDWLAYSICFEWEPLRFSRLMDLLDEAKAKTQESNEELGFVFIPEFGNVIVHPTSFCWGGAKGQLFDFKLQIDGTDVGLARKAIGKAKQPNVFVNQTGSNCLLHGGRERCEYMLETIQAMGCRVVWSKVSRADLAIDIVGLPVEFLQDLFERDQFVTRFRNAQSAENRVNRKRTGFYGGRAPCYLTVYDKLLEVVRKISTEYLNAMIARRWQGKLPEVALRLEWQLRRSALKSFGASSPEDLFERAGSIFAELMSNRFRLTETIVDRSNNNQSKAKTHPVWAEIANVAELVFGVRATDLLPIKRDAVPPFRAIRTARGHLRAAMQDLGISIDNYEEFLKHGNRLLQQIGNTDAEIRFDQEAFLSKYQKAFMARALDVENVENSSLEDEQHRDQRSAA